MRGTQQPVFTPTAHSEVGKGGNKTSAARQNFVAMAITMGWQLAVVVLVPVIGGAELDKKFTKSNVYTFIGLAIAVVASGLVMWRAVQAANKLPVPKLTDAQRRAIKKSYEEDDD